MGVVRLLTWPLRPLLLMVLRWVATGDPWARILVRPRMQQYGLGAVHDFSWYFEGDSAVEAKSLVEVREWLLGCEYIHDPDQFGKDDYWQHPSEFEKLRRGDCEDHALWAWRKLVEIGLNAELVCGRILPWDPGNPGERGHVWVIVHLEESSILIETVAKHRDAMFTTLDEATTTYRPEYGVDRSRKRFTFNGALLTWREREFGVVPTRR